MEALAMSLEADAETQVAELEALVGMSNPASNLDASLRTATASTGGAK